MFHYMNGSIFDSECEVIVNPVNCLGQSGKGLALQFKQRFPVAHKLFAVQARQGNIRPGEVFILRDFVRPFQAIVFFPTKLHWINPSRIEWIEEGLEDIVTKLFHSEYRSIALPKLGCGLGGLEWPVVESKILGILGMGHFDRVELYAQPTRMGVFSGKAENN